MKIRLAGCVIVDDYGRILLLHRSTNAYSQWELPGGKLEQGESPEQAATRELAELGVEVQLVKSLGTGMFEDSEREYEFTWFEAVVASGEPQICEPETFDDIEYFDPEDMMSISLSANLRILLPKLASGGSSSDLIF